MKPVLRPRSARTVLALALSATLAAGGLAYASETAPPADPVVDLVVDGGGERAVSEVTALGGTVTGTLELVDGITASLPASKVPALREALPSVNITRTAPAVAAEADAAVDDDTTTLPDVLKLTGADDLQAAGITGKGVDVAVIDTGIAPLPGVATHVDGPDLSFDSQVPALTRNDGYGHGTAMAAIIAGNGTDGVRGMAPDARLVDVKVGSWNGAVDVSQIIAAIDWVVQNKNTGGLDIRVLNLSVGTDTELRAAEDPLAKAVDNAWRAGIVVVAAVGNDGKADRRVASPSSNPNVIAVGAADSNGSSDPSLSTAASFSSIGNGRRKPDLVAPGARVLSLRVPGSYLDERYPAARRGERWFRGSGTSQSTAVVSGAAALLLSQRPELTPDQVKALLLDSARTIGKDRRRVTGRGQLDVAGAAQAPVPTKVQSLKVMTGRGSLEDARGTQHVVMDGVVLRGDRDIFGKRFDSARWAKASALGSTWSGGVWNGSTWSGSTWSGSTWSGSTWSGSTWSGSTWSGSTWSGSTWSGSTWSGSTWSGSTWSGSTWSGSTWSGSTWSGSTWSGVDWLGSTWG